MKSKVLAFAAMVLLAEPLAASADPLNWFVDASLTSGGSVTGLSCGLIRAESLRDSQTWIFVSLAAWWATHASLSSKRAPFPKEFLPQMAMGVYFFTCFLARRSRPWVARSG